MYFIASSLRRTTFIGKPIFNFCYGVASGKVFMQVQKDSNKDNEFEENDETS
jgi:hypothetical protein